MRKSDAATIAEGTPGRELMMRAARGVFNAVAWKAPVAVVCGSGNNAGDGYALALCLHGAGIGCTVFCTGDRFSEDGRYYHSECIKAGVEIRSWSGDDPLAGYGTVVDCLLGTGFKGEVRPELREVIEAVNASGAYTVSVDINSGLNGDNGMAVCCVRSDLTVSVGGFKPGHFLNMAKDVMKDKINVDIGITPVEEPFGLIGSEDVRELFGERPNLSNKGTYGYTALIGGSVRYSGAIRLAGMANAAMRSGAGVVKVAVPRSIVHDVAAHILESTIFPLGNVMSIKSGDAGPGSCDFDEVVYIPEEIDELISNVKCVTFGMGVGTGDGARGILEHLLEKFAGTLVIDADGLNLLAKLDPGVIAACPGRVLLTPHIKEFSRLTGLGTDEILSDPTGSARSYAKKTGAAVLLKGPSTIVTDGEKLYITDRGCAGMATAGSGDVLSGILSAVCCNPHPDLCLLAAAGAYINGAAGELASQKYGNISMIAGDTVAAIPELLGTGLGVHFR